MATQSFTKQTGKFNAVDQHQQSHEIVETSEYLAVTFNDNTPSPPPQLKSKSYRLRSGEFLNKHDENTFETVTGTLQLKRAP